MLYVLPFISAAIGWFTNFLAIKMLFHPRREWNLYFFRLQGVFPKRQPVLAEKLGKVVGQDLFSMVAIKERLYTQETSAEIERTIEREVDAYLERKVRDFIPPALPFVKPEKLQERVDQIRIQLRDRICRELHQFTPQLLDHLGAKLDQVDVEQMVTDKVANFSADRLESLLMNVIRTELRFVEISGAVLGFLIGLVQILLLSAFK